MITKHPTPTWKGSDLAKHRGKHRACFEDLLKVTGRQITEAEYAQRVQRAIERNWLEYESCKRDIPSRTYLPPRATYVDDDLVVAVTTDLSRQQMVTGFHEDFDKPHGAVPGPDATVGDRKLTYRKHLGWDAQSRLISDLRVIKNV